MENCDNLLLIGNGFDITCGLKSSYSDFFYSRYSKSVITFFGKDGNLGNGSFSDSDIKDCCILDYIFLSYFSFPNNKNSINHINWNDIETIIEAFLSEKYDDNKISLREINLKKDNMGKIKSKVSYYGERLTFSGTLSEWFLFNFSDYICKNSQIEQEFWKSIKIIEKNFNEYLSSNESDINQEYYKKNCLKLFEKLAYVDSQTYVMSFNYTKITEKNFFEYSNIHGILGRDQDIIFGIDSNLINSISNSYKYTKTYRKLLLESQQEVKPKKLPAEVKKIIFYGHSLSKADYSYFQSIFDFYNIYSSEIELFFYFNSYKPFMLEEQVSAISSLLEEYGDTMTNRSHGKNLLHKLSLEGRIKIKDLELQSDKDSKIFKF